MIRAVVFDMDGLMFDSETIGISMFEKAMEDFPYDFSKDFILSIIGTNERFIHDAFLQHYGNEFPFLDVMNQKKLLVNQYYDKNDVPKKRGLIELLKFLKDNKIKMAVATSSNREKAEFLLQKASIISYFDIIVCGDEVEHSKPSPEIYVKAITKLNCSAEEAIVLEDSQNGLIAAHEAQIRTVFIKDHVSPREDVINNVTLSAESLLDVIQFVKKENALE